MKITKSLTKYHKDNFIRLEFSILEAEKLKIFLTDPKEIFLMYKLEKDLKELKNPSFSKERFFVVRGKIGEQDECGSCFYDVDNEEWNYCPNCGNELDELEEINNVYRSYEKAEKDQHVSELGVKDIFVVLAEERGGK